MPIAATNFALLSRPFRNKTMKLPKLIIRKKLRATAVRRPLRAAAQADYDEMSEPNMKLSRALLIVLLLHVVAVSGIIAFNAIKTRQGPIVPISGAASNTVAPPQATIGSTVQPSASLPRPPLAQKDPGPGKSVAKETGKARQTQNAKSADLGKVYIVVKGDNPVTIAKKFKVSYDELVALNHIDDPRRLRIGQKLVIPTKAAKATKTGE
jgi:LysM repeat protein